MKRLAPKKQRQVKQEGALVDLFVEQNNASCQVDRDAAPASEALTHAINELESSQSSPPRNTTTNGNNEG